VVTRSAQIVLPCANLNRTLEFFVDKLAFRIEMISPADAPVVAVISGFGTTLRLEASNENQPLTIKLSGDFSGETAREIYSPDGVRVCFESEDPAIEIPEATQEFVLTAPGENGWSEGRAGMQYRDLIPGRLGGRFIASHIRIPGAGEVSDYVHYHRVRFQMIYCLAGWARVVYEDQGAPFVFSAGDCVLQPPEIRHRVLECSAGFEVLEVGSPAAHETLSDHAMDLPNETYAPERLFGGQRFLHHNAADAVWKKAQIEGFEYSKTGISDATGGLADVRVIRALTDASFPAKHSGEFMFFFVLAGNLRLSDGAGNVYDLEKGSSFVLPAGAEYFIEATSGLEILRVSLQAVLLKYALGFEPINMKIQISGVNL
jgi:quercetin dioxygenase-like cupin family protein